MELILSLERLDGIAPFNAVHIGWLLSAFALSVWCAYMAKRYKKDALRAITFLMLLMELARVLLLSYLGALDESYLPLHLCSVAVYVSTLFSVTENDLCGELLYSTLAPCALIALLFPDWINYRPQSFIYLTSYGIHMLIIAYDVSLLSSGLFMPRAKRLPLCFAILSLYAFIIYFVDLALDVNYLFLMKPSPGSPLMWFAEVLPWHGLIFFPMLWALWLILYLPLRKASAASSSPRGRASLRLHCPES